MFESNLRTHLTPVNGVTGEFFTNFFPTCIFEVHNEYEYNKPFFTFFINVYIQKNPKQQQQQQ